MNSSAALQPAGSIDDPRWKLAASVLLQNITDESLQFHFLSLFSAVITSLFKEGSILFAWQRDGEPSGFIMDPIDALSEEPCQRSPLPQSKNELLRPPASAQNYSGQTEVLEYTQHDWSGLYFRGSQPMVEGWLLVGNSTVNCNAIIDNHRVRDAILSAVERFQRIMDLGAARHRQLEHLVDNICNGKARDRQPQVKAACELLRQLTIEPSDGLDLAARLGRMILNELIDGIGNNARLASVQADLQSLHDKWQSNWQEPADAADNVRCLLHCFSALLGQSRDPLPAVRDEVLAALPAWIEQQQRWLESRHKDVQPEWHRIVDQTLPMIQGWLAADFERLNQTSALRAPLRHLTSIRNRMCLWLCLELLQNIPQPESEQRRILSYEIRESLRFVAFGERKDNLQHLSWMAATHAAQFVPYCDIQSFLRALGATSGINHYSAPDHLRHALDIYVTGHFILQVQVVKGDAEPGAGDAAARPSTVADLLFGSGPDDVRAGKAAFSLAALFHDVDMLFVPDRAPVGDRFVQALSSGGKVRVPPPLQQAAQVIDAFIGTGDPPPQSTSILDELTAVLGPAPETGSDDTPDDAAEQALRAWLVAQRKHGLDHGTLSAWFLLHMCRRTEQCQQAVLRQAVRGVLLHEAQDVAVSLSRDPITGLLVLLNEIFVWDPKWLGAEALDRWINPAHLSLTWTVERGLQTQLVLPPGQSWPLVRIALQPELPLRLWQIALRKARNLGRLLPWTDRGFSPRVELIAAIPDVLQSQGYNTHSLLSDCLASQVPDLSGGQSALRAWLAAVSTQPTEPRLVHGSEETLTLGPLGPAQRNLHCIPVDLLNQLQDEWEGRVSCPPHQDELGPGIAPRVERRQTDEATQHQVILSRHEVRGLLEKNLPDNEELDAFLLDHFPEVRSRFPGGMDRTARLNLLLDKKAPELVREKLQLCLQGRRS